jgi:hypothetical protein
MNIIDLDSSSRARSQITKSLLELIDSISINDIDINELENLQ